jgi:uncharacterized damage-inducible protein DinB
MDKLNFELLAKFNKCANDSMNKFIRNLTEEQWKKEFSGFFKSIQEICSHIYFWDYNCLNRLGYLRNFKCLNEEFKYKKQMEKYSIKISKDGNEYVDKNLTSSTSIFNNTSISEYIEMRIELDNRIINFVNELETNELEKYIKFTTIKGKIWEKRMDGFLIHLSHHQTHHRSMISIYLDMLGIKNEFNDLIYYVDKENTLE